MRIRIEDRRQKTEVRGRRTEDRKLEINEYFIVFNGSMEEAEY